MKTEHEKFVLFYGLLNSTFKVAMSLKVLFNRRFFCYSNNFQKFKRKAAQFSGCESKTTAKWKISSIHTYIRGVLLPGGIPVGSLGSPTGIPPGNRTPPYICV